MTNKTKSTGTPTPCQPWCNPKKHLFCGGPLCCSHIYDVPRTTRKPKRKWTRSGW